MENKRVRPSRFDVLPGDTSIEAPRWEAQTINTLQPSELIAPLLSSFKRVYDPATQQMHMYISATDETFQRKLDSALEKNLQFLERIDSLKKEAISEGVAWHSLHDITSKKQVKFLKLFNPVKKQEKSGIGVAKESKASNPQSQPETRVYINNLPLDITNEELDILFSPHGKIKKIKIYTDGSGNKKGDALITFLKPESVVSAIVKLNGLDIGDGHKLTVQRPDYSYSFAPNHSNSNNESKVEDEGIFFDPDSFVIDSRLTELIRRSLPHDFAFVSQPIVIVANSFSYEYDDSAIASLEAKLMIEACRFGDIDLIQSLFLSLSPSESPTSIWKQLSTAINAAGIFVLTFKDNDAAQRFVKSRNSSGDNVFHERDTLTVWIPYNRTDVLSSTTIVPPTHLNPYTSTTNVPSDTNEQSVHADAAMIEQEAADVEEFLNSLL